MMSMLNVAIAKAVSHVTVILATSVMASAALMLMSVMINHVMSMETVETPRALSTALANLVSKEMGSNART